MAIVFIPALMRTLTHGKDRVCMGGSTVREIVDNLDKEFPGTKERLVDKYKLKPSITVAVDSTVSPMGLLEKVEVDSEVHFLTAIGGGFE